MGIHSYSRKELADIILEKLTAEKGRLKNDFNISNRIHSAVIDNLLPEHIANEIYQSFPKPEEMGAHKSLRENKHIAAQMNLYKPLLEEIEFAFQDLRIVKLVEKFTGLKQLEPDESLYAGGISVMTEGNFLNPHLDNSHDYNEERYRVINLLYYVSPNWMLENGGNLELWDDGMQAPQRTILSKFNRLVFMITDTHSIHSVSKVLTNEKRCCISNYYFSKVPATITPYHHLTSFYGRPEEPIKKKILAVDRFLRNSIKNLIGKKITKTKHIYKK